WNDTYIINLTGRRDGSSRFGPNRQFANFGAVGAAWVFSKESFATKVFPFINYGKLRGSYGTSGNDQIGDYEFLDTFTIMGEAYDGIIGIQPARLYNPNFAWEVNKKLEFALELNMFKDRIQLTTSYFRNISTNQLVGIPLPTSTGFTFLTANLDAKVKNTGLELDLHTVNFQKTDFQWATSFNVTFPDNELVEFPGLEESTYANTYVVGESLSIQKLYHYTGLSTDRGIYQYEDYNNDGAINSAHDKQWIEDMAPKYYGGISNSLTYKNLSLDFFFQFTKQKSYNFLESIGLPGGWGNMPSLILDRWQQPGDQSNIQRYTTGADGEAYDAYDKVWRSNIALTDASFIRLKNISIAYTIPVSKMNGVNCRLYFQGQNLLTFSNYKGPDPEQAGQRLGVLKRLNFGVEINF
ncbi:MAG: hypothetical protein Q7U04_16840, partial [Bacteriovorax sp.]|nr:hypothetical protein [Bacteriovorax sp.]